MTNLSIFLILALFNENEHNRGVTLWILLTYSAIMTIKIVSIYATQRTAHY